VIHSDTIQGFKTSALQRAGWLCALLLLVLAGCGRNERADDELRLMADAPARMVWCRQQTEDRDLFVRGTRFKLMGICTEDRGGERVILRELGNYHKPMITADGSRVVYTDAPSRTIYVVNWNGTGMRELATGVAEELWMDPQTGIEWVYSLPNSISVRESTEGLVRFQLDNPAIVEMIWDQSPVNSDAMQLSADGAFMSIQNPHPRAGVLDVKNGTVRNVGRGCWAAMAPDNSYLMWIFDGAHRNLIMHSHDGKSRWSVNVNGAPGMDGYEVYHPRWSNRKRFISVSGPYRNGIMRPISNVNVYAGRLNETMTEIESWVQISSEKRSDFYPDLWIAPDQGRYCGVDADHVGEATPVEFVKAKIVVEATLKEKTETPTPESILPYTQTMVVYRYQVNHVVSGDYSRNTLLVAHWGIVDRKVRPLPIEIGDQVTLELEAYENRGELEGERLIMELTDMQHPLFYDLKGN
jgi:hypothetical protein